MAVFRVERTRDYTVMCNHHLKDSNLSLKAKGLLSMMLSLPDEWNYTTRGLAAICKEGVDAMDDEETAGAAFGRLAGEFVRTKVAPEMDAFRFSVYASHSGIGKKTGDLTSGDDALAALIEGQNTMDEAEVPEDQRYLFISPALYNLILNVDRFILVIS